ncbi:MAG: hypothetical protein GXO92_04120 [FCB group bacterium]|nr:hypothetical protein [FCB group bacterium]
MRATININPARIEGTVSPLLYGSGFENLAGAVDSGLWIGKDTGNKTYRGHGCRVDLMERIIDLKPGFIRWPGGWVSERYRWKEGIGDPKKRPERTIYYSPVKYKEHPCVESNQFGTDEFMRFCQDLGAEPILVLNCFGPENNVSQETLLEEAVQWLEYCNGDSNTEYGGLRADNGNPEPYHVKYWEIGNEAWSNMDVQEYIRRYLPFAKALKAKDPSIQLIATGFKPEWNAILLSEAGAYMDFIALHDYPSCDYSGAMAIPLLWEDKLIELKKTIKELPHGKDIKVSFNEWNSNTNWKNSSTLKEGLYGAALLNVLERQSDFVEHAGAWPLLRRVQPKDSPATDHGLIFFDDDRNFVTPVYLVSKLYRDHFAPERIFCEVECPAFDYQVVSDTPGLKAESNVNRKVPVLDAVATVDRKNNRLVLKVVNKSENESVTAEINISGPVRPEAEISILNGDFISQRNRIDEPENVHIVQKKLSEISSTFVYTYPPHSATIIEMRAA